jgi:hypothetical protein
MEIILIGFGIGVAVGSGVTVSVDVGINVFVVLGISVDGNGVISGTATFGAHAVTKRVIFTKINKAIFITELLAY